MKPPELDERDTHEAKCGRLAKDATARLLRILDANGLEFTGGLFHRQGELESDIWNWLVENTQLTEDRP